MTKKDENNNNEMQVPENINALFTISGSLLSYLQNKSTSSLFI